MPREPHDRVAILNVLQKFDDAAMEFQERIIMRSGLGDETYLPKGEAASHLCGCPNVCSQAGV